jgi:hypothetical protein
MYPGRAHKGESKGHAGQIDLVDLSGFSRQTDFFDL